MIIRDWVYHPSRQQLVKRTYTYWMLVTGGLQDSYLQ